MALLSYRDQTPAFIRAIALAILPDRVRLSGASWNLPDLELSEKAYILARQVFESDGRIIINATHGGKLEIFPKTTLLEQL